MSWNDVMLGNYSTPKLHLVSGSGCYVKDIHGNRYLDLIAGIAVSSLGHAHPAIIKAVSEQARLLVHTSNLYSHDPGIQLAAKLLEISNIHGKVFFGQDGATVNEAAIKLCKLYGHQHHRTRFIAFKNSFHGRTLGALALTGNPTKREPFAPFGLDVTFVDYGDIAAVESACDDSTVAVFVESIQGEGGMNVPPQHFLEDLRRLTQSLGILLVVDEVQSGIGRTGKWFAASHVQPDIITLAKGIAGGLPLGAMLVKEEFASYLPAGSHGTTFGGNPVSCAAALAVIQTIETENLLSHVLEVGAWFADEIVKLNLPQVAAVDGEGLWLGIKLSDERATNIEIAALANGFLINAVRPDVIRLAPPLVITKDELKTFLDVVPLVLGGVST